MRLKKDGGLDMRFKAAKDGQAALIMLGVIVTIIGAILYFIYKYLHIILPLVIIIFQFNIFKNVKTKFRILFSLSSLLIYAICLAILVYINIPEPVDIYGSYYNNDIKLEILKNKNFTQRLEDQIIKKKYDEELIAKSKSLINFANNNPNSSILKFTKKDESDYKEYSYYGILNKKNQGNYETTLEKIYDKYDKPYIFTDGNPTHKLNFIVKNKTWFISFKGLDFELGSIIAIRFILLSGLLAIIASSLFYIYFSKLKNITKE